MLPRSLIRMMAQPARQIFGRSFSSDSNSTNAAYTALKARLATAQAEATRAAIARAKAEADAARVEAEAIEREKQLYAIQSVMDKYELSHNVATLPADKREQLHVELHKRVNKLAKRMDETQREEFRNYVDSFFAENAQPLSTAEADAQLKAIDPKAPTIEEINESYHALLQHEYPVDPDDAQNAYQGMPQPNPEFTSEFIDGVMPDASRQSKLYGTQREEYEFDLAGLGGFNEEPSTGPFGTMEEPVLVFSSFSSRVAGCKGGHDLKHRLLFFNLYEGKKHVCLQCGQAFKLITPENIEENDAIIRKAMTYNRAMLTEFVPTAEQAQELLKPETDYGTYKL